MPTAPPIRWVEEFALATDGWIKAFPLARTNATGARLPLHPTVSSMERNFKRGVTGYDPPVNVEHKPEYGRVGVIRDMQAREDGCTCCRRRGVDLPRAKRFGYASPKWCGLTTRIARGKRMMSWWFGRDQYPFGSRNKVAV